MKAAIIIILALILVPLQAAAANTTFSTTGEAYIAEMRAAGIGTLAATDLLREAELAANSNDNTRAEGLVDQLKTLKDRALRANNMLNQMEPRILELESNGADTRAIRADFDAAMRAFLREDFGTAESTATSTLGKIEEAESSGSMEAALAGARPFDFIGWLKTWWWAVLAATAIVLLIARKVWRRVEIRLLRRQAAKLLTRKKLLLKLMKEIQQKHFIEGTMGKNEYVISKQDYRSGIADASRKISVIEKKLSAIRRVEK